MHASVHARPVWPFCRPMLIDRHTPPKTRKKDVHGPTQPEHLASRLHAPSARRSRLRRIRLGLRPGPRGRLRSGGGLCRRALRQHREDRDSLRHSLHVAHALRRERRVPLRGELRPQALPPERRHPRQGAPGRARLQAERHLRLRRPHQGRRASLPQRGAHQAAPDSRRQRQGLRRPHHQRQSRHQQQRRRPRLHQDRRRRQGRPGRCRHALRVPQRRLLRQVRLQRRGRALRQQLVLPAAQVWPRRHGRRRLLRHALRRHGRHQGHDDLRRLLPLLLRHHRHRHRRARDPRPHHRRAQGRRRQRRVRPEPARHDGPAALDRQEGPGCQEQRRRRLRHAAPRHRGALRPGADDPCRLPRRGL